MSVRDKVAGTAIVGALALGVYHVSTSAAGGDGEGYEPFRPGPQGPQPVRTITVWTDWAPMGDMLINWTVGTRGGEREDRVGPYTKEVGAPRGSQATVTITPVKINKYTGELKCDLLDKTGKSIMPTGPKSVLYVARSSSRGLTCSAIVP